MNPKIVYYTDELTDDFVSRQCPDTKIDEKYKYLHKNLIWNFFSFILYRLIATPLAYIYMKLKFKIEFIGKDNLKKTNGNGYFIYINHTQMIGDALLPTLIAFSKKVYVVVNPYNVLMPGWGHLIRLLGPLPLPSTMQAWKNFNESIQKIIDKKQVVTVYPEAHVWNYYTKIREYSDTSFKYPLKTGADCYAATVTYQKFGKRNRPQMVVYIDGPFDTDEEMPLKMRQKILRNKVYETMCERSKNSNVEYITYQKMEEKVHD